MRFIRWALVGFQLGFAAGFPGSLRRESDGLRLVNRQVTDQPPDVIVDDNCRSVCTPMTCGGGSNTCPALRRVRRSATEAFLDGGSDNNSSSGDAAPHALGKRDFTIGIGNARANMDYIKRQMERFDSEDISYDPQFGPIKDEDKFTVEALKINWDPADATVSRQRVFKRRQKFQWGTDGLMGCTMLLVVSARAVWMGHMFEVGAFCGFDDFGIHPFVLSVPGGLPKIVNRNCQQIWNNQVVAPLMTADVVTSDGKTISKRIDPNLFNGPEDNTRVIFMIPRNPSNLEYALYHEKTLALSRLVLTKIPGAQALVFPYTPLDPDKNSGDYQPFWESHRSCVLFQ